MKINNCFNATINGQPCTLAYRPTPDTNTYQYNEGSNGEWNLSAHRFRSMLRVGDKITTSGNYYEILSNLERD